MNQNAASIPITRIDRRIDERGDCLKGLLRWLESSRKRLGLYALVLADRDGCLVAGAGSSQLCEELAARAPLPAQNQNDRNDLVSEIGEGSAWLCAPKNACDEQQWASVREGCVRILGLYNAA
jgi:hypothetical protein